MSRPVHRHCWLAASIALLPALLAPTAAPAHSPSNSYLSLAVGPTRIEGRWDIALRDLEHTLGLDRDGDGAITWGELSAARDAIGRYALGRLAIDAGGQPCPAVALDQLVAEHADGPYTVLLFSAACNVGASDLGLTYRLFADTDPLHRGLLRLDRDARVTSHMFSPGNSTLMLPADPSRQPSGFTTFLAEGFKHILIGVDHILFLLTLLVSALVRRDGRRWLVIRGLRQPLLGILKTVTAFTIAHSVTLSLAVLGFVYLPPRLTESLVALSIVVAGLNNVRPFLTRHLSAVAFGFGLVHGLGFASALTDLGLPRATLLWALLTFNLGIEVGQFMLVAIFVPLLYSFWFFFHFEAVLVRIASAAIAGFASIWFFERALGIGPLGP